MKSFKVRSFADKGIDAIEEILKQHGLIVGDAFNTNRVMSMNVLHQEDNYKKVIDYGKLVIQMKPKGFYTGHWYYGTRSYHAIDTTVRRVMKLLISDMHAGGVKL